MSRYTEYGFDAKWGKIQINYGTDRALGYWYDVFRCAPLLMIGGEIPSIDIETGIGYVITNGVIRAIKTFDGEHWFEKGEKALFELNDPYDFYFEDDYDKKEPCLFPASNHIWLSRSEVWEDYPILERCTTFDELTVDQWLSELTAYGITLKGEYVIENYEDYRDEL